MTNDGYGVSAYGDIHTEYAEQESKNRCGDVFEESETIHEMVIQEVKNGAESDEQSDELYNLFILIDIIDQIIFCDACLH
jgi:predicted transcriptional regulator